MTATEPAPYRLAAQVIAGMVGIALGFGRWLDRGIAAPGPPTVIAYGDDPCQRIAFRPARERPAPLILFVHGGGWCAGSAATATGRALIRYCAVRGIAFASVDYRLVPRVRVEVQAADIAAALARLVHDAAPLGIDPARVVLVGHSAGAHLAALIATRRRWLDEVGLAPAAIGGVIGVEGAAYDVALQLAEAPTALRPLYWLAFGRDPMRHRALSPALPDRVDDLPRFLLLHADRTDGTHQTLAFAAALRQAGATVEIGVLPGRGLAAHITSNRRLGDPDYPGTAIIDRWLAW